MKLEDVYEFVPSAECPRCKAQGLSLFFGPSKILSQFSCPKFHTFSVRYTPNAKLYAARLQRDSSVADDSPNDPQTQDELKVVFADDRIFEDDVLYPVTFSRPPLQSASTECVS